MNSILVSIVTYSGISELVIPSAPFIKKYRIHEIIPYLKEQIGHGNCIKRNMNEQKYVIERTLLRHTN